MLWFPQRTKRVTLADLRRVVHEELAAELAGNLTTMIFAIRGLSDLVEKGIQMSKEQKAELKSRLDQIFASVGDSAAAAAAEHLQLQQVLDEIRAHSDESEDADLAAMLDKADAILVRSKDNVTAIQGIIPDPAPAPAPEPPPATEPPTTTTTTNAELQPAQGDGNGGVNDTPSGESPTTPPPTPNT